ncbi:MAG TPA: hypothetical protein PKD45_08305 [Flavobacteriales bacterium]|nr:hypothetical protein [Flavobacteriales bacterium]
MATDGSMVVAGSTGSFGGGASDIYLLNIDGAGAVLWTRTIGGPAIEQARDLILLQDGGLLVVGVTNDTGGNGYDGLLVRTDENGNTLWQRRYGGSDWDFFNKGVQLADGSYLVVGQTFSTGVGGDIWLMHIGEDGEALWSVNFGGGGLDTGEGIAIAPDGGYILAGSMTGPEGGVDAYALKLDAQMAMEWESLVGGDGTDVARDVVCTLDGGYSFVGGTSSYEEFMEHLHFKLDGNGALVWERHWGQVGAQEAYEHIALASGGYATAGWTTTSGGGRRDMFLFLCDDQGQFISQRTYGGSEDDEGYSIAQANDGFVVCGMTRSYGAGNTDVFVVRTDSSGATESETVSTHFDPLVVQLNERGDQPTIYPNPSTGVIQVTDPRWQEITLFDGEGKVVLKAPLAGALDLHVLRTGPYMVALKDHGGNMGLGRLILIKP